MQILKINLTLGVPGFTIAQNLNNELLRFAIQC